MAIVESIETPPDDGMTIDAVAANEVEASPDQARPVSKLERKRQFEVLKEWIVADADHSRAWRENATYWHRFRSGEQWSDEDRAMLEDQERPVIVFNRVLTILKAVAGMEINGRHEIAFLPRGTEDTAANEVLSAASKWMADSCDGEDEESAAFDRTCTTGMGWTEERIAFDVEPDGLYVEEMVDEREMYWDRAAKKKNLSDTRRRARVRTMPLSDAIRLFPGKTKFQLDAAWASDMALPTANRSYRDGRRQNYNGSSLDEYYDDTCEVTIVHVQWIEYEIYWIVADEETQTKVEMTDPEYQTLVKRFKMAGLEVHAARMERRVFKHAFLGSEMLTDVKPAPIKGQFSWKCITGEFDAATNTWFGLVKVMRDPQLWANKWLSQILHMLNSSAKGGIIAELDAFDDQEEAEESLAYSDRITVAANGAVSGGKIMPKPGQAITDGYVGLLTFAISSIKDVTGINLELLGQQDQNQPGILEAMRKQAGMTVLATLFDSLRRYRKEVGRTRLYFIQSFFSDGRLVRVVGPEQAKSVRLAKENTTGIYDVVVDDTPTSPNQKEQNWAIIQPLLAVFKDQLVANPEVFALLLEYSPLPSRIVEAIKGFIQKQQNDPQQQQEQQQNRQLMVGEQMAKIERLKAQALLDTARAGGAEADKMQSLALARNMLEDNNWSGLKALAEAKEAEARARIAEADVAERLARGQRENQRTEIDRLEAEERLTRAETDRASQLVANMIDRLTAKSDADVAQSTVVKNLAQAKKLIADANRPDPKPAARAPARQ